MAPAPFFSGTATWWSPMRPTIIRRNSSMPAGDGRSRASSAGTVSTTGRSSPCMRARSGTTNCSMAMIADTG